MELRQIHVYVEKAEEGIRKNDVQRRRGRFYMEDCGDNVKRARSETWAVRLNLDG
jgi:hypothetical protein